MTADSAMKRREVTYEANAPRDHGLRWPGEPATGWTGFAEATYCAYTGHIRATQAEAIADVRAIPDCLLLTDAEYEELTR